MSCALVGCLVGAMLSGLLSERFGRKPALLAAALVFTVSSIGTGLAASFDAFVLFKLFVFFCFSPTPWSPSGKNTRRAMPLMH